MSAPPEGRRTTAVTASFDDAGVTADLPGPPSLPPRYDLGRELGRGGMATVYAAFDHQLGREVAVKHLRGDDPRLRLRFAREARLVAALRHAGIVTIYDVDPDGEYLIMELVDGGSVAERLAARRVTPTDARRWLGALLAALAAAHAAGIVHRDVKPSNLLLTGGGELKLADFGVATMGDPTITAEHARVGTPAYMAPEQLRGDGRAPAVDVWAVGATAYELYTGVRFVDRGATGRDVVAALRRAGADATLAAVIARAVADEPSARFGDAGAMAQALVPRPRRARRAVAIVAAAAMIGGGATLALRPPRRSSLPAAAAPPRLALLGFDDTTGDPSLDYARYGLPHILAVELQPVPGLATIDYQELRQHVVGTDDAAWRQAAAARGATVVVDGALDGEAPPWRLAVRLRRVDGRELARWERHAAGADVPRVLRDLAPQLASAVLGRAVTLAPPALVPADAEGALARGIDALARTDLETAERALTSAVALAPGNAEAAYFRAVTLWWRGAAADVVRAAVAAIPLDELTPARRDAITGLTLFVDHRYAEAIAWFAAALTRNTDDRDLAYGLFEARFHGGDPAGAIDAFRALRARFPRFGLGALHVFDYAMLHDDDALVAFALDVAEPDARALWAIEVDLRRGRYEAAAQALQAALDRPHPPRDLDRYMRRCLALAHALGGHVAFARALVGPPEAWPLDWALAEATGDPAAIAAAEAAYLGQRASSAPGLARMTLGMEAAILALAGDRPPDQLRAAAARLDGDTPVERRGDSSPRLVRMLLAVALADDAALAAEADGADTPELRAALAGALAERRGDLTAAGAAWAAARAVTIDARLAILEDLTIARLARARGDRRGVADACARVVRPPRAVEAWGPAAPRCRAWLAEAAP